MIIITYEVNGMAGNIKNWVSHEKNMTFTWNKASVFTSCLKDHIFRNYHFLTVPL